MPYFSFGTKPGAAAPPPPGLGAGVVLEGISTAVIALDADFSIFAINSAAEKLINRYPQAFAGRDAAGLIGANVEALGAQIAASLRAPQHLPKTMQWRHGEVVCSLTLGALRADGLIIGYTLEFCDISALAAQARQDSQELKIRAAIMDMTSIFSLADLKGNILSVNQKFCELSRYDRNELIGSAHNTTRHPDVPREFFKEMWTTIARGKIFRGVIKNRAKDGSTYYVDTVIAPVVDADGKLSHYIGAGYDITGIEIMRHNTQGLLAIINESYAYCEFDLAGNILNANEKFLKTLGYPASAIKGQHHGQFLAADHVASPAYARLWEDLRAGRASRDLARHSGEGGTEIWLQSIYAPIKDDLGRVLKIVQIAMEVGEQIKATKALEGVVAATSDVMTALRAKDLSQRLPSGGASAEIQRLASGVNGLIDTLAGLISSSTQSTVSFTTSLTEITTGTEELAAGCDHQAAGLAQGQAALEAVASAIRLESLKSEAAKELALAARALAIEGEAIIAQATQAMARSETYTSRITALVEDMDDIAFRSDLAALNAAVEIARNEAGDSPDTAVGEGRELVAQRATAAAREAKAAAREQELMAGQINETLGRVAEITRQNSAKVTRNTTACRRLQREIEALAQRMAKFRLNALPQLSATEKRQKRRPNNLVRSWQGPLPFPSPHEVHLREPLTPETSRPPPFQAAACGAKARTTCS